MEVYPGFLTADKAGRSRRAQVNRWLRAARRVAVWTHSAVGYVLTSKVTARQLIQRKGDRLSARFEGRFLFLEPAAS